MDKHILMVFGKFPISRKMNIKIPFSFSACAVATLQISRSESIPLAGSLGCYCKMMISSACSKFPAINHPRGWLLKKK